MKSLKIIQVLAVIARVICIVVFVACIVGAAGCALALTIFPLVKDIPLPDEKTISSILVENGTNWQTVVVGCVVGLLACGVNIFLAKYNEIFYRNEIKVGTPFKREIVREMRITAIVNIAVSVSAMITLGIIIGITKAFVRELGNIRLEFGGWLIGYGIALLVISLFCDYSAEKEDPEVIDNQDPEA